MVNIFRVDLKPALQSASQNVTIIPSISFIEQMAIVDIVFVRSVCIVLVQKQTNKLYMRYQFG